MVERETRGLDWDASTKHLISGLSRNSTNKIYGPYFFEKTVTQLSYLDLMIFFGKSI
jgi:hypothetical protein